MGSEFPPLVFKVEKAVMSVLGSYDSFVEVMQNKEVPFQPDICPERNA